jgi:hypothetical protein
LPRAADGQMPGPKRVRQNTKFQRAPNDITSVKTISKKYFCFVLSEIVIVYAHPAST